MNKNAELLKSFTEYAEQHPEMRFWQALTGWSGFTNIYAKRREDFFHESPSLEDPFYWEGKDG